MGKLDIFRLVHIPSHSFPHIDVASYCGHIYQNLQISGALVEDPFFYICHQLYVYLYCYQFACTIFAFLLPFSPNCLEYFFSKQKLRQYSHY